MSAAVWLPGLIRNFPKRAAGVRFLLFLLMEAPQRGPSSAVIAARGLLVTRLRVPRGISPVPIRMGPPVSVSQCLCPSQTGGFLESPLAEECHRGVSPCHRASRAGARHGRPSCGHGSRELMQQMAPSCV